MSENSEVTALLKTRCGCSREMPVPGGSPLRVIAIPLRTRRISVDKKFDLSDMMIETRYFEWVGWEYTYNESGLMLRRGRPIYEERP